MSIANPTRGLIIAAPSSGSGKTVVTLGILAALKSAGVKVASMKAGPDYIDPAFHGHATQRPCFNIDPWAMTEATQHAAIEATAEDADLIIVEGVMGLFDGATVDQGSTADIAKFTDWPVVLIVDSHAQGASAAAQVLGFATYRDDINLAGVIFNRVGSERHQRVIRQAMDRVLPNVQVLGMIPYERGLELPSRHLGLVQASEHSTLNHTIGRAGHCVEKFIDLTALQALSNPARLNKSSAIVKPLNPINPLGNHIAVAQDEAFAFAYPLVLQGWRNQGALISFFSPLADEAPDAHADAVFLPGGYPELHAYRLANADTFLGGLRNAAAAHKPVYGECGGYMVLGESMIDADGIRHEMAGLLAVETTFETRKLHLGYREVHALTDSPLGPENFRLRGHEFHYASVIHEGPGRALFKVADADGKSLGEMGQTAGSVMGSFIHLVDGHG